MDGAFPSRALGRECDLSTAFRDVSDAGGDGGVETGVDDGSGDDVCFVMFQRSGFGDAETARGSSSDSDVYPDDRYVCHNSRSASSGVFAGDEREIGALRAVDYRELFDHWPRGGVRQSQGYLDQLLRCVGNGDRIYVWALCIGVDPRATGRRRPVDNTRHAGWICELERNEASGGGVFDAGDFAGLEQSFFPEK